MAIVGIKRLIINNETVQTKTGTIEYKLSGGTKTPIVDDGSGDVMAFTQERTAGMIKAQLSSLAAADTEKYRELEDAEIVAELLDGKTIVGSFMTQTADNPVVAADGVLDYEFMGNVKAT